jgi:hypothetical protein
MTGMCGRIAHHPLGEILAAQDKSDEAIGAFHTPVRIEPEFASAHTRLGIALKVQGNPAEAIPLGDEQAVRRALVDLEPTPRDPPRGRVAGVKFSCPGQSRKGSQFGTPPFLHVSISSSGVRTVGELATLTQGVRIRPR